VKGSVEPVTAAFAVDDVGLTDTATVVGAVGPAAVFVTVGVAG
jgi:hypothetical protein